MTMCLKECCHGDKTCNMTLICDPTITQTEASIISYQDCYMFAWLTTTLVRKLSTRTVMLSLYQLLFRLACIKYVWTCPARMYTSKYYKDHARWSDETSVTTKCQFHAELKYSFNCRYYKEDSFIAQNENKFSGAANHPLRCFRWDCKQLVSYFILFTVW